MTPTNRRQRIGYLLTMGGLSVLLGGFLLSPLFAGESSALSVAVGIAITVLPLAALYPRALKRDLRAYQALALLAPVYLFIAGVIWLWRSPWWGLLFALASIALEVGTILHNYQKRERKRRRG